MAISTTKMGSKGLWLVKINLLTEIERKVPKVLEDTEPKQTGTHLLARKKG